MTDTEMILEQIKGLREVVEERLDDMDQKIDRLQSDMDQKIGRLQSDMDQKMDDFKADMLDEFQKQNDTLSEKTGEIDRHLNKVESSLKVYMENVVDRRIAALIEGREVDQEYIDRNARIGRRLDERVDSLETRVAVLESKTTA